MLADVAFRIDLPHGRCVGVRIPASGEEDSLLALALGLASLADEERAHLEALPPARKTSWLAGRIALHEALRDLKLDHSPILSNTRGAPDLPDDVTGSISHKRTLAVALAARRCDGLCVGVDIEPAPGLPPAPSESRWEDRPDISSRVMTPAELARLAALPVPQRRREVILYFSIKEAIYKALNPALGRYVSFQEATICPAPDGSVTVTLELSKREGPFRVEARWLEIAGHLLTTAAVWPGLGLSLFE
jgi:enterobactin synthetase component D